MFRNRKRILKGNTSKEPIVWNLGIFGFCVFLVYQALWLVVTPFVCVYFLILSRSEPKYRMRFWQRFGFWERKKTGFVWINAASAGETRAAAPLIRSILDAGYGVLLTHATPDGHLCGRQLLSPEISSGLVRQGWVPLDIIWCVMLFLRIHHPRAMITVEGEIWPSQVLLVRFLRIPLVAANGNLTEESLNRNSSWWLGRVRLKLYGAFNLTMTKSPEHVARYIEAGVQPSRVVDVGELKADLAIRSDLVAAAAPVRALLANGRPGAFLIASSTKEEFECIFSVVQKLRTRIAVPPAIVWAPRDPQTFSYVTRRLKSAGMSVCRRSEVLDFQLKPIAGFCDILIGDSIGEMDFYYQLADVVFVGATLDKRGGHNITEPLAHERPVVTGPSIYGIAAAAPPAIAAGVHRVFLDSDSLAEGLVHLFSEPSELAAFMGLARGYNLERSGAARRSMALLEPLLLAKEYAPE